MIPRLVAAFALGASLALLAALALIPEQPDRILVPVPPEQIHQPEPEVRT